MQSNHQEREDKQNRLPLYIIFPNLATLLGLCFGLSSIKYALDSRWEHAVALLVISAFIDGMDGRLARMLNASSKFGAELDSLVDFVNFGVAPAIITYAWSLKHFSIKGVGWAVALLFTISMAIRLARFNSELEEGKKSDHFNGIPAPCGAGLTMVPIMLSFHYDILIFQNTPIYYILYIIVVALLTSSTIPTISIKNVKVAREYIVPLLLFTTLFIIALIVEPWVTLPIMGLLYISSVIIYPISEYLRNRP